MGQESNKPILLSSEKPLLWWQRPALIYMALAAIAVLIFGLVANRFAVSELPTNVATATANPDKSAIVDAVQTVLRTGKPTVIEFGANNCVSCREMKPILHALAQDQRITVADVDILKEREYISRYQIRLMPTQVFYDSKGNETSRHMGKITGEEILVRLGISASVDISPRTSL